MKQIGKRGKTGVVTDVREHRGTLVYRDSIMIHGESKSTTYHEYSLEEKEAFAAILNYTL